MSSSVPELVLASASPARLRLLRDAGFDPKVVVSGVDEDAIEGADPWERVSNIATAKARAVAATVSGDRVVIGCDSMLLVDGELLGKAPTPDEVMRRWVRMRGSTGVLLTGHCVVTTSNGREVSDVADTLVRFGSPSDEEISAYAATEEARSVAGPFTIDGRAAAFVESIDGDAGNVIGLSLPLLRRLLAELGVEMVSLWS